MTTPDYADVVAERIIAEAGTSASLHELVARAVRFSKTGTGSVSAIRDLLERSDQYPTDDGVIGFGLNRDGLIALLGECTPSLNSISVIPDHDEWHDMTSFAITTYVSFARSELGERS